MYKKILSKVLVVIVSAGLMFSVSMIDSHNNLFSTVAYADELSSEGVQVNGDEIEKKFADNYDNKVIEITIKKIEEIKVSGGNIEDKKSSISVNLGNERQDISSLSFSNNKLTITLVNRIKGEETVKVDISNGVFTKSDGSELIFAPIWVRASNAETEQHASALNSLKEIIIQAKDKESNIKESDDGNDILMTEEWVTKDEYKKLVSAIKDAETAVKNESSKSIEDLKTAITKLEVAIGGLNIQNGKKDADEEQEAKKHDAALIGLNQEIESAKKKINGVEPSTDSSKVEKGNKWQTQAEINKLEDAINKAEDVVRDDKTNKKKSNELIKAKYELNTAVSSFKVQYGTREVEIPQEIKEKIEKHKKAIDELKKSIELAEEKIKDIVESDNGNNVKVNQNWATRNTIEEFKRAIVAAKEIETADNQNAKDVDELERAKGVLDSAIAKFNPQKGTKELTEEDKEIDKKRKALDELRESIKNIEEKLKGVQESVDGTDIEKGKKWETKEHIEDIKKALEDSKNVEKAYESKTSREILIKKMSLDMINLDFSPKEGTKEAKLPEKKEDKSVVSNNSGNSNYVRSNQGGSFGGRRTATIGGSSVSTPSTVSTSTTITKTETKKEDNTNREDTVKQESVVDNSASSETVTVKATTKIKGNEATVTLSKKALDKIEDEDAENVVISTSAKATNVKVNLDKKTLKSLLNTSVKTLTIKTNAVNVSLNKAVIKSSNKGLVVKVEKAGNKQYKVDVNGKTNVKVKVSLKAKKGQKIYVVGKDGKTNAVKTSYSSKKKTATATITSGTRFIVK